jgi:NADH:ubiquinone oxidoreductase subunit E
MPSKTLEQIMEGRRSQPHQLIEVLQDVQENYGYISKEAMQAAAEGLGVPLMEVCRVASFYKAFKLEPCGKNHLIMCMGTACHVRGSRLLLEQAVGQFGVKTGEVTPDGLFSVEHVNCLGACALGPIAVVDGKYYSQVTVAQVKSIIQETAGSGNAQERHAHEAGATRDALSITGTVHGNGI